MVGFDGSIYRLKCERVQQTDRREEDKIKRKKHDCER